MRAAPSRKPLLKPLRNGLQQPWPFEPPSERKALLESSALVKVRPWKGNENPRAMLLVQSSHPSTCGPKFGSQIGGPPAVLRPKLPRPEAVSIPPEALTSDPFISEPPLILISG